MGYENILVDVEAPIATITLNRPKVLNALSPDLIREVNEALAALDADPNVRAVVLTGGPRVFAAGADISDMADRTAVDQLQRDQTGRWAGIAAFSKPLIAAVNGYALGGGCELAMACDVRLAAQSASFGQPEINLGIIPGFGGTQRLPRLIGEARALEMNLTGDPISAQVAYEFGLANRVVADHELWDTALAWAHKLADQAPRAVEQIKRVSAAGDLDAGIEAEKKAFAKVFGSEDAGEGISAFLQKRKPYFRGK